jgi:hypothetical protein
MGWKYEVMSWLPIGDGIDPESIDSYMWMPFYHGDSFFKAFYHLFKRKIKGDPCIKLEWR